MMDLNKSVKFSIVIPTYNREKLISRAIESVLKQDFLDWEIIIVDDGSTDNTKEILQKYIDRYKNIQYFFKENGGVGSARNYGIKKAQGEFLVFLDSDDELVDGALSIIQSKIINYKKYEVFFFGAIDNAGKKTFYLNNTVEIITLKKLIEASDIYGEFLPCVRRRLFNVEKYYFPEDVNGGEGLLWLNVLKKYKVACFNDVVRCYHLDAQDSLVRRRLTRNTVENMSKINKLIIKKFYREYKKYNRRKLGEMFFVIARMEALLNNNSWKYFNLGIKYNSWNYKLIFMYFISLIDYKYKINNMLNNINK